MTELLTRTNVVLQADSRRVLAPLFVPGHEHFTDQESRATGVLGRILALPENAVHDLLVDVRARFTIRHRDLEGVLAEHYAQIAHRLPDRGPLSQDRQQLLGAWFTHEYSLEAAALFNPSAVAHPDQSGLAGGELRFVISLRSVGEGHRSSIEFRSGVLGASGALRLDDPGTYVATGRVMPTVHERTLLAARLEEEGADPESTRFLLHLLPSRFTIDDLHVALTALSGQRLTRPGSANTDTLARLLVSCGYDLDFDPDTPLVERVLWPQGPSESYGMEDARFVRVVEDDGSVKYLATYTAFDGSAIVPQRIETADFLRFSISQLAGPAAKNKGMAFFPRKLGGQYIALSRWDRESCSLTVSDDGFVWEEAVTVYRPTRPWELIQTGNCGSPIETNEGWLVLTHGVGPMREYAIGALLLDLQDPTVVRGALREPLLKPAEDEREGYVPNVVYSCGALRHGELLLLPYGASDARVRFALVDLPGLLRQLLVDGPPATTVAKSSA